MPLAYVVKRIFALLFPPIWTCFLAVPQMHSQGPSASGQQTTNPAPDAISFKVFLLGNGRTEANEPTYFTKYKSSSGNIVLEMVTKTKSETIAAEKVEDLRKRAVTLIRSESVIDDQKRRLGELVFLLISDKGRNTAVLAWNKGAEFREISCPSTEDLKAFEAQYSRLLHHP